MGISQSKPLPVYDEKVQHLSRDVEDMSISREKECTVDYTHPNNDNVDGTPYTPTGVSLSLAKKWEDALLKDPKNQLAITAFSSSPIPSILTNPKAKTTTTQTFNIKVPIEGSPITNQRASGRCWLFASTNIFRVAIMKRYNLSDFELSQSYLFYWDKLEKANWFLEQMIETAGPFDLDDRLVQTLLSDPVSDGGQWDMVANLVKKYGLAPQGLYLDRYSAMSSSKMDWLITVKLREQALILRELTRSGSGKSHSQPVHPAVLAATKEKFMQEIHSVVTICLGPAPDPEDRFTWEFYDADGKFRHVELTPKEFAESLSTKQAIQACGGVNVLEGLFSLVNDPRNDYNRLLTIDRLGNVVGGQPITYVNVDMDTIKTAAISMLKAGHPIFFGCDVGKFSDSASGIMDLDLYNYPLALNNLTFGTGMSKAARLQTGESSMTHAMVITAVHVDEATGKPIRWRVQNSWGENAGDKGWFVMTDAWMDQFVYQVVVDGRFVGREVREVLGQVAKVLPRWDPMGVLA